MVMVMVVMMVIVMVIVIVIVLVIVMIKIGSEWVMTMDGYNVDEDSHGWGGDGK